MDDYKDIIDLPHHVSDKRARMRSGDRAAQFAPFAALAGYEDAVEETARLTDSRAFLEDDFIAELDEKLRYIKEHLKDGIKVNITYFVPDGKKDGGAYLDITGKVLKIDGFKSEIIMEGGKKIGIDTIYGIEILK